MENEKVINKALKSKYGSDFAGYPTYRIVQNSKSLREHRFGTFRHYYGKIFSREETGCFNVLKYSYVPEGLWILEKLFYNEANPELTERRTYEPLFVFYDKDGGYFKPNFKLCEFVIECALNGPSKILSQKEKDDKEVEMFYEMLGGDATVDGSIADGSGTSYAGLDAPSKIRG